MIDFDRIREVVQRVWGDYGYALIAGAGVLAAALVVTAIVKAVRSQQRDRLVAGVTALVVLAWTSEGLWEVARFTLGLPLGFAVMTFFVYEAMMITCAMQAAPSPGRGVRRRVRRTAGLGRRPPARSAPRVPVPRSSLGGCQR